MYTKIAEIKTIDIIGQYGIQKCKERHFDVNDKPVGKMQIWYDVCLECGDGDIVASFKTLKEARKWAKEN